MLSHLNLGISESDINNNLEIKWNPQVDVWWNKVMQNASDVCEPVWLDAEDPLFLIYTR